MKNRRSTRRGRTEAKRSPTGSAKPTAQEPVDDDTMQARYRADLANLLEQRAAKLPPVQQAWGTWLFDFPWEQFVTLTFRQAIHPEQAHKRLLRWLNALEHDPSRAAQPLIWACGEERQGRGAIHYHLLVAGVAGIDIEVAISLWTRIGGGWVDLRPYDRMRGAAFYVAKGDIELSPVWFTGPTNPSAINVATTIAPSATSTTTSTTAASTAPSTAPARYRTPRSADEVLRIGTRRHLPDRIVSHWRGSELSEPRDIRAILADRRISTTRWDTVCEYTCPLTEDEREDAKFRDWWRRTQDRFDRGGPWLAILELTEDKLIIRAFLTSPANDTWDRFTHILQLVSHYPVSIEPYERDLGPAGYLRRLWHRGTLTFRLPSTR